MNIRSFDCMFHVYITFSYQEESSNLQELIETLRGRQKQSNDARLEGVETENRKLIDDNLQLHSQVRNTTLRTRSASSINQFVFCFRFNSFVSV